MFPCAQSGRSQPLTAVAVHSAHQLQQQGRHRVPARRVDAPSAALHQKKLPKACFPAADSLWRLHTQRTGGVQGTSPEPTAPSFPAPPPPPPPPSATHSHPHTHTHTSPPPL